MGLLGSGDLRETALGSAAGTPWGYPSPSRVCWVGLVFSSIYPSVHPFTHRTPPAKYPLCARYHASWGLWRTTAEGC